MTLLLTMRSTLCIFEGFLVPEIVAELVKCPHPLFGFPCCQGRILAVGRIVPCDNLYLVYIYIIYNKYILHMYINFLCGIETASCMLQYSIHVMNMCIHVLTLIPPFV